MMDKNNPDKPQLPKRRNLMNDLDAFFERNPFGDVLRSIDDFFSSRSSSAFPVHFFETEKEWVVEAELPGAERKNIHIELFSDKVKISVNNNVVMNTQHQQTGAFTHECRFDHAERIVTIPYTVDRARTQASYINGILKIHGPKTPKKGHRLSIE
ncbi:Hsp20/alpha crystallin family protein [Sporolactobacillus inulinus]|jgi:HSP20 family protein|uniref:Heat-shock protein Hsp20 n=2 Tax=Sporolactobacillus inulinus TaxID=2078 RepID=A0A0U1QRV4_9BACL|nr:Hsp20/alpha crystallin family protein [Sporolactobacillus inulinus]KLI03530.1 heat-shock protein Hsp20 [Sporolactobacillus inulinus CASD]